MAKSVGGFWLPMVAALGTFVLAGLVVVLGPRRRKAELLP